MFKLKLYRRWKANIREAEHMRGFNYAAQLLLMRGDSVIERLKSEAENGSAFDRDNAFDKGIHYAIICYKDRIADHK